MTLKEKKAVKALAEALDQYIACLGEELGELAPVAEVHGWRSSRVEKGKLMRKRIGKLKVKVNKMMDEP